MKVKSLQLGKALSAALFVLLLSVAGSKNALAQTLVATLQHGDDIGFYYGSDALRNAYDAAESGDIITLSSGVFANPNSITKAITLRGAGCDTDTISVVQPTVINSDITFGPCDETNSLTVEGIRFAGDNTIFDGTLTHPKFIKCSFKEFHPNWMNWSNNLDNAQFTNCLFDLFNFDFTNNIVFINCMIWRAQNMNSNDRIGTVTAFNSIIRLDGHNAETLNAYNCIIIRGYAWSGDDCYHLAGYSEAHNCIGINDNINTWAHGMFDVSYDCMEVENYSDVFETFTGFDDNNFDFTEPFILKSDIATGFLGNDGTEVGIHGGFMPYTARPSYQIVRQYTVPNKSDAQGHMNVGIELY